MAENKKKSGLHLTIGAISLVLGVLALVLFLLSFTTNYYTFGGLNSPLVLTLILGGLVFTALSIWLHHKFPENTLVRFAPFAVIACFAAAAMLLVGDRVEGIGTCIMTDYDSGHGGEEAIYMSLASSVLMLIAVVYNIIGCFHKDPTAPGKKRNLIYSVVAAVLVVAVAVATIMLTGVLALGNRAVVSDGQGGYTGQLKGTYTASYNQNNGNLDELRDYQFLCSDFSGIANYDSRFFLDMKLTLDGAGSYQLFSEAYCVEAGKRCEVGDDTGLGQVITMNAEGSYTTTDTGTVITSVPTHAVFEMELDTYSVQMKEAVGMKVGEHDEDGVYDSNEYPEVLDFVPETAWTLADGAIVKYGKPALGGTYTVTFNQNNGNVDLVQDYEFLPAITKGLMNYDSRLFLDLTLTLDGAGNYSLFADSYCVEAGKRCEIGDDTGLGMILTTTAEGTYVDNGDGTVTTSPATHAVAEFRLDTYSVQMKEPASIAVGEHKEDGSYDSAEFPEVLDLVPETVWTLADGAIVSYLDPNAEAESEEEEKPAETPAAEGVTIVSDDEGTKMTFFPDGTYRFDFESYGITDEGTYTYADGVLTLTDVNGVQYTADGDPMHLHYGYSGAPDQLTGEYTIPADTFDFPAAGEVQSVTIVSDDEGTKMTFNSDGTYRFDFEAYSIVDEGTYTYEDGVLTLTDVNGVQYTADGDPMHLHYGYSGAPDQLTGEYTIPADTFDFDEISSLTVISDDRGTTITLIGDGTYRFWFEPYQIEDLGIWQIADGILSLTDANGKETRVEGAPYKLHYVYSQNDQLTGDYTIPAIIFPFHTSGTSIPSDDFGTGMTFFKDGTYLFSFDAYGILDEGTWTFEKGVLTLTDANGKTSTAKGESLKLHYAYSMSDQLTGDFTIDPAIFAEKTDK